MTDRASTPGPSEDSWRRTDALFSEALELPRSERSAFLERACGPDEALRSRLDRLLRTADRDEDPLMSPERMLGADLEELFSDEDDEAGSDPHIGLRLGPYALVRRIGRGGSGSVYVAERVDGLFEARVAVKLLRRGVDTDDVLRRFRAERRILASLQHPNIARLIDGGATPDGRPYLVMELIDGVPLTDYCDTRRLSVRQRLEMFVRVARAVEYAHQSLVVHRDIKPSNILVAADEEPKLLDFGIAKLLDPQGPEVELTATRARMLTPAFASPEQLRGERITTATDVYQLGILLYTLLTGQRPFDDGSPIGASEVRSDPGVEPARPSTVVGKTPRTDAAWRSDGDAATRAGRRRSEPARLGRELRGDLDTIVMTCLRPEPARRYGSAAALADDVRRFLASHPIRARRPTIGYTMLRFMRRRPGVVAALAAISLVVWAYMGTSSAHARQLQVEWDRAQSEERRATQVSSFLVELFSARAPGAAGDTLSARALLDAGVERIRTQLTDDPETRGALLLTLGQAYDNLGAGPRALELLHEALQLHTEMYGEADPRTLLALERVAHVRHDSQHDTVALALLLRAITLRRAQVPVDTPAVSTNMRLLALTLGNLERTDSALVVLDEVIAMRHGSEGVAIHAGDLHDRGRLLFRSGDFAGAELAYREALPLLRATPLDDPSRLILLLQHHGMALRQLERPAAAEPLYQEALALQRASFGSRAPRTLDLIKSVAHVLDNLGRHDEAEPLLRESVEINRAAWGDDSWQTAGAMGEVGAHFHDRGDHLAAESAFRASLAVTIRALGQDHSYVGNARSWLARALAGQSRFAEAEAEALHAVALLEASPHDAARRLLPEVRGALASLYDAWGRPEEAAAARRAAGRP
ncbi:MAG: serine/threonine protein kinase [Gemmatimonadales bacterium]|nr:MAG: serine/threonine protein kinase [Gemmatimonadales bacterium]